MHYFNSKFQIVLSLSICKIKSIPWSIELIERYKNERWYEDNEKLNWYILSNNESLPWSIHLLERFKDKWSWWGLSQNKNLPWSIELISRYENKWVWQTGKSLEGMTWNHSLPWSVELIDDFKDKWDWIIFECDSYVYLQVFKPLLNDEFIEEVMNELQKKYS